MKEIGGPSPDTPPSYDESLIKPAQHAIGFRIAAVQQERVQNLLAMYIDPLMECQATLGILKMAFALIPSDIPGLQDTRLVKSVNVLQEQAETFETESNPAFESIEGFAEDENVRLVRLQGEENNARFWEQPSVVQQLEQGIRQRVEASSGGTDDKISEPPQMTTKPTGKGLIGKLLKRQAPLNRSSGGTRGECEKTLPEVQVNAGIEELCIRYVTPVGLYDTRSGRAVVVRVRFGA